MANYKSGREIVDIVYGLLGPLSASTPVFKYTKPPLVLNEYIVVNALPVNAAVLQKCYINVNYHVKDIEDGKPNDIRLRAGFSAVMNILEKVSATNYLIDFESTEEFEEAALKEHFVNMRFSVKYFNK